MVRIGNQAVLFETSVILRAGETASVTTTDTCSVNFKIVVGPSDVLPQPTTELTRKMVDQEATFSVPYLPNKYVFSAEHAINNDGDKYDVFLTAHGVGQYMVLQIQCRATAVTPA